MPIMLPLDSIKLVVLIATFHRNVVFGPCSQTIHCTHVPDQSSTLMIATMMSKTGAADNVPGCQWSCEA